MAPPRRSKPKLGIVAGGGALPLHLIAACRASGRDFHVLALEGQADPTLGEGVPHDWNRLGAGGAGLRKLRYANVEEVVFAGRVKRPSFAALRPDARTLAFFARLAGGFKVGDNALLSAVVREVEAEGFRVVGVEEILADLVATVGPYGAHRPDDATAADIDRGIEAARALGRADKGQAAVVAGGEVLGVEGEDGTDALIRRCHGKGGVLVKVAKPGQERRVDLPTIGPTTVDSAAGAGLKGIAIEAGHALVLDRDEVARRADAAGLFVVGVTCR
jgi:DUF1009 family protein